MLRRPLDPRLAALAAAGRAPVPLVTWDTPGSPAPALVVRVGPVARTARRLIHTPQLALRPHSGGLLHLEAPDAAVDLHTPEAELPPLGRRAARPGPPHGARPRRRGRRSAIRSASAPCPHDGQSIVGRLPGAEWLYVAVTHSGVTLAAHLSRLIAAELDAGAPRRPRPVPSGPLRRDGCCAYYRPFYREVIGRGLPAPHVRRDSRLAG